MRKMTKERLESYRSNLNEIKQLEYTLNNRWKSEKMIGVDTILDYSKGYPIPQMISGFDRERYERQQNRDLRRKAYLEKECKEIEEFVDSITINPERTIFRLYFIDGNEKPTQEEVARKVHIDRSRVSRKIDIYLKNAHKAQKAHL